MRVMRHHRERPCMYDASTYSLDLLISYGTCSSDPVLRWSHLQTCHSIGARGNYQSKIISIPSKGSRTLPLNCLFYRFRILLIGIDWPKGWLIGANDTGIVSYSLAIMIS